MAPRRKKTDDEVFEYRWTGDYAVSLDGHTTPEGTGVLAEPGKNFFTVEPLNTVHVPRAVPVSDNAQAASEAFAAEEPAEPKADDEQDDGEPDGAGSTEPDPAA